jgi:hypothetical protein
MENYNKKESPRLSLSPLKTKAAKDKKTNNYSANNKVGVFATPLKKLRSSTD